MEKIQLENFLQYAQAASQTLNKKATKKDDAGHYGLGVATEYFELIKALKKNDRVNIGEECSDCAWYLSNHILDLYKIDYTIYNELTEIWWSNQLLVCNQAESLDALEIYFEQYTDICKKAFVYRKYVKDYPFIIGNLVKNISSHAVNILLLNDLVPKECLERNINKLYARYGTKFNAFLAMNRNLLVEHDILSEGVTV